MSEKTATILSVHEGVAEFLGKIGFPTIPEDTKYIVFFEGETDIVFLNQDAHMPLMQIPHFVMLSYYDNVKVETNA